MKALRLVLLGLALAVIAGLGWRLFHPAPIILRRAPVAQAPAAQVQAPMVRPEPLPDAATARSLVLSRLADAPDYVPFFDRLRTTFPGDYLALVDAAAATVGRGGHVPNPDRLMIDGLRHLRQSRGILAAQAEDGPLASIFVAQLAVLDALAAENSGLCADFAYGGMSPTFMAFVAKHRDLLERLGIASLSAIASGQTSRIERAEPKQEDFDTLTAALQAKGLSDDEVSAVLDGKTFDPPLPEDRVCLAARTYLTALQTLPDEARSRIYALSAALLARS